VAVESCWAITQAAGLSSCGRSGSMFWSLGFSWTVLCACIQLAICTLASDLRRTFHNVLRKSVSVCTFYMSRVRPTYAPTVLRLIRGNNILLILVA
jgi:hypothetical protein